MLLQEKPLSNLQLELLKLYHHGISDEQLRDIRKLLADYFFEQATNEADRLWEERSWTEETMDTWLSGEDHD